MSAAPRTVPFTEAFRFWLKLGFISFGGPAGQIAIMHRELVEEKRWISESRFLHALNYCMLLPGPEAQQLATYIGWLLHRTWGGIAAGLLFVLPSLFILIGLSWVYVAFGNVPGLQVYVVKQAERFSPRAVDVASGLNIAAFNVGIAFGAWAGGLIVERLGLVHTGWIGGLVVLGALALTAWAGRLDQRDGLNPAAVSPLGSPRVAAH